MNHNICSTFPPSVFNNSDVDKSNMDMDACWVADESHKSLNSELRQGLRVKRKSGHLEDYITEKAAGEYPPAQKRPAPTTGASIELSEDDRKTSNDRIDDDSYIDPKLWMFAIIINGKYSACITQLSSHHSRSDRAVHVRISMRPSERSKVNSKLHTKISSRSWIELHRFGIRSVPNSVVHAVNSHVIDCISVPGGKITR